jgi:catechol 2,3-dioxygenase
VGRACRARSAPPSVRHLGLQITDRGDLDAELGEAGVAVKFGLNHGNAWSLYFADPEGNLVECFVQSPWHTRQPVTDPLDLSLSDEEIRERTKEVYASDPEFQPVEQWRAAFAKRLADAT